VFLPLLERYGLAIPRHDYFEPPFQQLLMFARSPPFAERAHELGGYDVSGLGQVTLVRLKSAFRWSQVLVN